ncbi:hypothetical protein [Pedobacter endophyticus]|uniref:Lipoprotein n=1 Tax=Pedobacter endophyticus TaxID=2789740 RepID=A0A7U3SQF9_9SPHI|nr:hypothetical protein [Pedobacter endophyticus]QPH38929.1 hypothetical protein IZT61_17970 [Pedobacter endophyticus]
MQMIPNKTLIHYLMLGAYSLLLCVALTSCKKDVRSRNGEFYYINETDHNVIVSFGNRTIFSVKPGEKYVIKEEQPSNNRRKDVVSEEYVNPLSINDLIIRFDNKCLTASANSSNSILAISSYEAEKIADAQFRFTYRFTQADYDQAGNCP